MTAKHKFIVLGARGFRNTTTGSSKSPQKQNAEHVTWTQEEQMNGTRKKQESPLRRQKWRDFFFLLYRDVFAPLIRTNVHQIKASSLHTNHPRSNSMLDGALRHCYYVSHQTEQHWITQHQTLQNHSRKVKRRFCQAASTSSPNIPTDFFGLKSWKNHSISLWNNAHVCGVAGTLTARVAHRQTMAYFLLCSALSKLTMRICLAQAKRLQ